LSLLLILESFVLNLDLDSWNLNLETWFLILEIKFPFEPWSVLDSILNSFFDSWDHHLCYHEVLLTFEIFVIIFVIIKTLWINLDSSWSLLLHSSPFWWWQLLKSRNTLTHFFLVDHSHKFPFSPFVFEFMLLLKLS